MTASSTMRHGIVHVVEAQWFGGHRVRRAFDDGLCGEVELSPRLHGPVFESLRDTETFRRFSVGEGHTLEWANAVDLAPEFLHELVRVAGVGSGR